MFAMGRFTKSTAWHNASNVLVNVEPDFAKFLYDNRGVEDHRLMRLVNSLKEEGLDPACFFHMEDGSHLLSDGTHRYCAFAMCGLKFMPSRVFEKEDWADFEIDMMGINMDGKKFGDDYCRNAPSGIA